MMRLGEKVSYEIWSVNNHLDPVNYPDRCMNVTLDIEAARNLKVGSSYDKEVVRVTEIRQLIYLEPARDLRDEIEECPWCGPDGTARHGDSEKICPECGGDHIKKPAREES